MWTDGRLGECVSIPELLGASSDELAILVASGLVGAMIETGAREHTGRFGGFLDVDTTEKKAEYATGIPWYWVVWIGDNRVIEIDVHVLDDGAGEYRLYRSMAPAAAALVEVPVRIELDLTRLPDLVL